ncbi:MAG TPA: hypothetical protein VIG40_00110 [Tissierellaceae bacterium]
MSDYNQETASKLRDFLLNEENKILIFKGKWGIGKTYFWKECFEKQLLQKPSEKEIAAQEEQLHLSSRFKNYSYLSLFGIEDINTLKSKLFNNSQPLPQEASFWSGSLSPLKVILCIILCFFFNLFFENSLKSPYFFLLALSSLIIIYHSKYIFNMRWIHALSKLRNKEWKLFQLQTFKVFLNKRGITRNFFNPSYASKLLTDINKIGIVKRYLGDQTHTIENQYIKDMVICFDDIERMNSKLPITALMGYADELAQQKNCKIVFIFNEDALLKEQKNGLDQYREKIVDLEYSYAPTLENQLEIVFGDQLNQYPIIKEIITEDLRDLKIEVKNIRVLSKIKRIMDEFFEVMPDAINEIISNDFIKRLIFLSYFYFEKNDEVPFVSLKYMVFGGNSSSSPTQQIANSNPPQENSFEIHQKAISPHILKSLYRQNIVSYSPFSKEIINRLENGIWSTEIILSFIESEKSRISILRKQEDIHSKLDNIWKLYRSSFKDDLDKIISGFKEILDNKGNYPYWEYPLFISTLISYYQFRQLKEADIKEEDLLSYIDDYIEINRETIKSMPWEKEYSIIISINSDRSNNEFIVKYAEELFSQIKKEKSDLPLSEFVKTLRIDALSEQQKYYIQNITLEELKEWLREVNDPNMVIYIDTLRTWIHHVNPNKPSLIDQALKNIANENPLNNYRVHKMILKS